MATHRDRISRLLTTKLNRQRRKNGRVAPLALSLHIYLFIQHESGVTRSSRPNPTYIRHLTMGQRLSATACCSCLLNCWDPQRSSKTSKSMLQSTTSTASTVLANDVQQPLVVEDESWKKWSSYNLIHDKDGTRRGDDSTNTQYNPPVFVSHTNQQDAEAVWDL